MTQLLSEELHKPEIHSHKDSIFILQNYQKTFLGTLLGEHSDRTLVPTMLTSFQIFIKIAWRYEQQTADGPCRKQTNKQKPHDKNPRRILSNCINDGD